MTHRAHSARLFVAVDPPEQVADRLQEWARTTTRHLTHGHEGPQQAFRVLDPHLLHVTVLFLGERPLKQVPELAEQLQACARPSVELSVGAPLWLPSRRPRALAVELHDSGGILARIHAEAEARLESASRSAEPAGSERPVRSRSRRFHPHITVTRMRPQAGRPHSRGGAAGQEPLPPTPPLSFSPTEVTLYRSWLSPEGASYEALASFALGDPQPD